MQQLCLLWTCLGLCRWKCKVSPAETPSDMSPSRKIKAASRSKNQLLKWATARGVIMCSGRHNRLASTLLSQPCFPIDLREAELQHLIKLPQQQLTSFFQQPNRPLHNQPHPKQTAQHLKVANLSNELLVNLARWPQPTSLLTQRIAIATIFSKVRQCF